MGRRPVVRRLRDPRLPDPAVLHLPGPRLRRTRHSTVSLAAAELRHATQAGIRRDARTLAGRPRVTDARRPFLSAGGVRGRPASEVEAAGDTAAENRPDPGSHVRIKIYEIERRHPAQAEQLAEDPDDDVSVPSPKCLAENSSAIARHPHDSRIYFFQ